MSVNNGLIELAAGLKNDLVDIDVDNWFKPPKSRIHCGMFGNLSLRSFLRFLRFPNPLGKQFSKGFYDSKSRQIIPDSPERISKEFTLEDERLEATSILRKPIKKPSTSREGHGTQPFIFQALSITEPTWFSAKNWCLGFFESHGSNLHVDGSEIPRPTNLGSIKSLVKNGISTTNLNWWVNRISEPSTVWDHIRGTKFQYRSF